MWGSRQILMALVFALIGGAAWWLLEQEPDSEEPALPRERRPDYVVSEFTAVETDKTGRPARALAAQQMRQYIDEDLAELDLPHLSLYQTEGPPWQAESNRGLLLAGGDEVRLSEDVRIHRAGTPRNRQARLDTSELTVWPKRQYAQGNQPVRIESERDWLTAAGLRLWYAEPMRAEFPGRAHLYIAPASPTEPTATGNPR
ncbi:MAG: LPS export ABC transporter periplasmic protein LptC [Chromatiaceae bacterium]